MPFAALIPALISAGGAIGGSMLSSRAAKSAQKAAMNSPQSLAETNLINQQAGYGRQAGDVAGRLLPTYEEGIKYLGDYFKNLLGPDNSTALQAIAPLVRARQSQTAGLLRSADFLPRGGASSETYSKLYDDEGADVLDLLGRERESGRAAYGSLIGDVGARGAGLLSSASGSSGSAASLMGTQADRAYSAGENARAGMAETMGGLGAALGPLLIEWMRQQRGSNPSAPPSIRSNSPAVLLPTR